jgi:hypothetical protein
MANKSWTIDFKLPQLAAGHYWQSTTVEAPDLGLAIKRAWAEVKKRPSVKGKRIKQATIAVTVN